MKKLLFGLLLLSTFIEAKTFIKEYTYTLTEDDSKRSARKIALNEIKMMAIEEFGVEVSSNFSKKIHLKGDRVSRDISSTLKSYSKAITKTKILEERYDGETMYIKAQVVVEKNKFLAVKIDPKDACKAHEKRVKEMLAHLKQDVRVEDLVTFAIQYPFTRCERWHLYILSAFSKEHIQNERYKSFLLKQLQNIKEPSQSRIALYILSFLAKDATTKEQPILYKSIAQMDYPSRALSLLARKNPALLEAFIPRLFKDSESKKLGTQRVVKPFDILAALYEYLRPKQKALYIKAYAQNFTLKERSYLLPDIARNYYKTGDAFYLEFLVNYFTSQKPSRYAFDAYMNHIRTSIKTPHKEYMQAFVNKTQAWMQEGYKNYPYSYILKDFQTLLMKNGIKSAILPSPASVAQALKKKLSKKALLTQLNYLKTFGPKEIKKEEQLLVRLLKKRDYRRRDDILDAIFSMLLTIKPEDKSLIPTLIKALSNPISHSSTYYTKQAKKLLIDFKSAANQALKKRYAKLDNHSDTFEQSTIIEILGHDKANHSFLSSIHPIYPSVKRC